MTVYDFGIGGYDMNFTVPSLSNGQYIRVSSLAGITLLNVQSPDASKTYVELGRESDHYYVSVLDKELKRQDRYIFDMDALGLVRIVFHNEFITLYVNNYWIYTFAFDYVYHPEDQQVKMSANGTITVSDVRLKELSDWREAIFVDMETSTQNAIGSVVLQRPIDIRAHWTGALVFEYDPPRTDVPIRFVRAFAESLQDIPTACSDAVVYFTNAAVVVDEDYARSTGFVTKMYRFPDLDNGAIQAARVMQKKSRQSAVNLRALCRFNPSLEIGDIAQVDFATSDTVRVISRPFIVESISLDLKDGAQSMTLSGRDSTL